MENAALVKKADIALSDLSTGEACSPPSKPIPSSRR